MITTWLLTQNWLIHKWGSIQCSFYIVSSRANLKLKWRSLNPKIFRNLEMCANSPSLKCSGKRKYKLKLLLSWCRVRSLNDRVPVWLIYFLTENVYIGAYHNGSSAFKPSKNVFTCYNKFLSASLLLYCSLSSSRERPEISPITSFSKFLIC